MALEVTSSSPPQTLNHFLIECPEKNASHFRSKALSYSILSKICMVAIVAICAVVLIASLGASSGTFSLVLTGLAIATPFLAMGASKLHMKYVGLSQQAEDEQKIFEELTLISNWSPQQIEQFFTDQDLSTDSLPLAELKKLHDEPLKALLPLIARFNYLKKAAQELEEGYLENYQKRDKSDEREIRIHARKIALEIHNYRAIPKFVEAAVTLETIAHPILNIKTEDIGSFKDFQMWACDRLLSDNKNDDFFLFQRPDRAPLTHAEINRNLDPKDLRKLLFPTIRV